MVRCPLCVCAIAAADGGGGAATVDDFGFDAAPAPVDTPAADDFGFDAAPAQVAESGADFGFDASEPVEAAAPAAPSTPIAFEPAVPAKLQAFLDRQTENRAARKAAAEAKAESMKAAAATAKEEMRAQRATTIESKRKANLAADAAAKEFFATESNPWAKIVEYCDMKPKAQAKDAPKAKDTTRLRGMLLDLKHNPIEAK
mgnify:FL=1